MNTWRAGHLLTSLALATLCGACLDLGGQGQRWLLPDGGPDGSDDGGDCIEGSVIPAPTADGPGVYLIEYGHGTSKAPLYINSGDVVTWHQNGAHTVTEGQGRSHPAGGFNSGGFSGYWAYRFCTPRTVFYYCMPHSDMTDFQIVVQP